MLPDSCEDEDHNRVNRRSQFREWLAQAKTQKSINGWLAFVWLGFGILGLIVGGIRESIPVLFFISVYANVAGHWSGWQGGRTEVKQEEAMQP